MKKICFLATVLIISSCSSEHNEKMTSLINLKKMCEDSLKKYEMLTEMYNNKKETYSINVDLGRISRRIDSSGLEINPYSDTAVRYFLQGEIYKDQLKRLNFSIDSFSKMR